VLAYYLGDGYCRVDYSKSDLRLGPDSLGLRVVREKTAWNTSFRGPSGFPGKPRVLEKDVEQNPRKSAERVVGGVPRWKEGIQDISHSIFLHPTLELSWEERSGHSQEPAPH
jgi:hypothetical protein